MNQRIALLPLVLLLGSMLLGCEPPIPAANNSGGPPPPPGSTPPPPPAVSTAQPPAAAGQAPLPPETKFGVFAGDVNDLAARPSAPAAPDQPIAPPADPNTERVKAEKGVGLKGRSLDQYEGLVVTPAKVFFSAKERIAFEIQVPHALQLYEATNGEAPKTHDDFMANIIQANQIKLPILPPGHKYVYDPETKQLMVERPKRQ